MDSRNNILDEAKKEAAKIISEAQAQARELVARDQITQNAQKEATEIIAKAHSEGEAYVKQAQNQASELLGKATTQANEMVTTAQNKSRADAHRRKQLCRRHPAGDRRLSVQSPERCAPYSSEHYEQSAQKYLCKRQSVKKRQRSTPIYVGAPLFFIHK